MGQQTTREARMAFAKQRFVTLMKLMTAACVVTMIGAMIWFYMTGTTINWAFTGAIAVAIFGSLGLAAALMGLVFFSAASGADEDAD